MAGGEPASPGNKATEAPAGQPKVRVATLGGMLGLAELTDRVGEGAGRGGVWWALAGGRSHERHLAGGGPGGGGTCHEAGRASDCLCTAQCREVAVCMCRAVARTAGELRPHRELSVYQHS